VACYALYLHINYTFIINGGVIVVEDMESSALIALPDGDSDIYNESTDCEDDDDSTVVVLAAVIDEKASSRAVIEQQ
jgi:hypothetical protein